MSLEAGDREIVDDEGNAELANVNVDDVEAVGMSEIKVNLSVEGEPMIRGVNVGMGRIEQGDYATVHEMESIDQIVRELIDRSDLHEVLTVLWMIAQERGQARDFMQYVDYFQEVNQAQDNGDD